MKETKLLLMCKYCQCKLLTEKDNAMCMHIEYFTDTNSDTHVCYDCSSFKNVKRYFGSEYVDNDLDDVPDPNVL